jgi:hypothetical protein
MTLRLSGLLLKDPRSRGQEFAEECDNNVLMAYERCLRPALYSSLRSSPSHPTGVSALRVTIAIANARKQWGLRKSIAKSRRLFRNESATSRRVRAGAIGGSTAMTRTAFFANRREYRESVGLDVGPWEPATGRPSGDHEGGAEGGQDKSTGAEMRLSPCLHIPDLSPTATVLSPKSCVRLGTIE